MSEERLQEIKDSIEFQDKWCKEHNLDNVLIKEDKELIEEIERLNNIIKTFEGYLDNVLYTYRKNDLSEACIQLKLAKDKLKELKENSK